MRFKLAILLISLLACASPVAASPCLDDTYVFYVNGVASDFEDASFSRLILQEELQTSLPETCAPTRVFLNWNISSWFWGMPLQDIAQVLGQYVNGGVSADDPDLRNHLAVYRAAINSGRRVVVVAHSQGNFYANRAYDILVGEFGASVNNYFSIISVATPDRRVGFNTTSSTTPHVTSQKDPIKNVPFALDANTDAPCTLPVFATSWACHEFIESYLTYTAPRTRIVALVGSAFGDHPVPPSTATINVSANVEREWALEPGSHSGAGNTSVAVTPNPFGTWYTLTPAPLPNHSVVVTNSDLGGTSMAVSPGDTKGFFISYTPIQEPEGPTNPPGSSLRYSVTNLGVLGGATPNSVAYGINNLGEVVGRSSAWSDSNYNGCGGISSSKPYVWTAATGMLALEPSPSLMIGAGGSELRPCGGDAFGINDHGDVVGVLNYGSGSGVGEFRAYRWTSSAGMELIVDWSRGAAYAVANSGQIVGTAGGTAFTIGPSLEFSSLWLGVLSTHATALNGLGDIAGSAGIESCNTSPVIWGAGGGAARWLDLTALAAALPAHQALCSGRATGINDAGRAVGTVLVILTSGESRSVAFIADADVAAALDELPEMADSWPLGTEAHGINSVSEVVGRSNGRAFVWTPEGGIRDLSELLDATGDEWETLVEATAINDHGQIVGYGILKTGEVRAFLLTPVPQAQ